MKIDKLPVVDAKRSLQVRITNSDVQKGAKKNPAACAAVRACLRETECTQARVHLGRTYLKMGDKWVRYLTPQSVRSEIIAFDRGAKFAEGEYSFPAPSPATRLGSGRGSNTNRTQLRHKQKTRKPYHIVTGVRPHASR